MEINGLLEICAALNRACVRHLVAEWLAVKLRVWQNRMTVCLREITLCV